jgi:hypothetical protein
MARRTSRVTKTTQGTTEEATTSLLGRSGSAVRTVDRVLIADSRVTDVIVT